MHIDVVSAMRPIGIARLSHPLSFDAHFHKAYSAFEIVVYNE